MQSSVEIATIGHSNATAEEIIALLQAHHIALLVDVRSAPYSQYAPQFNRETFARTLETAGIAYVFAGNHLGGRPTDPTCYKSGALPTGHVSYLDLVDYGAVAQRPWYQRGVSRLVELAAERPTAIMCSEEDPLRCHRHHLIAQTLLTQGIPVWHIRRGGRREAATATTDAPGPQQLGLFAPTE